MFTFRHVKLSSREAIYQSTYGFAAGLAIATFVRIKEVIFRISLQVYVDVKYSSLFELFRNYFMIVYFACECADVKRRHKLRGGVGFGGMKVNIH
jgi:hypothetical protein